MTQLLNEFLSSSSAWGVLLTLAAFALGTLINRVTGKAVFNPLLLGSIFVIILLSVLNISYADYKISAAPVSYLLLPATISLAIPLYEKWDLLKENAAAIIAGISVGTLVSLGSALALTVAMGLTREQYVTLLPIIGLVGSNNLSTAIIILGIGGILIFVSNPGYLEFIGLGSAGAGFIAVFLAAESYRLERLAIWRNPEKKILTKWRAVSEKLWKRFLHGNRMYGKILCAEWDFFLANLFIFWMHTMMWKRI